MARLTFAEIVETGGIIGQNDDVPEWTAAKLKAWLRKQYAAWPWPFLITQATGISMTSGAALLEVGANQGGLVKQVTRIFSPIYYRADGYSTRGKAPIRVMVGDQAEVALGQVDPSVQTGRPQSFLFIPAQTAAGLMYAQLLPYPFPEKTYSLSFTYQWLPDDPEDDDVPLYPNEVTLLQAAKVAAFEYDQTNDPVYMQEMKILAEMVAADRSTYGATPSFGDTMQLDSSVFLP